MKYLLILLNYILQILLMDYIKLSDKPNLLILLLFNELLNVTGTTYKNS